MSLKIIYKNYWRKGTAGTPSSQHPQFPLTDSKIDNFKQSWRTTACTGAEHTGWLDVGAAVEVDFLALLGHNLGSSAAVTLYGADDESGTNQETAAVTWAAGNIFKFLATPITKRFWKIVITDTTNPAGYLEFTTIILGKSWTPSRPHGAAYEYGPEDFSTAELSDSLVLFGEEKPAPDSWALPFIGLDDAAAAEARALIAECQKVHGFVICTDPTAPTSANTVFVLNTAISKPARRHTDYWLWALAIREVQ